MKKKFATILCTVLCTAPLLAGCGAKQKENPVGAVYKESTESEFMPDKEEKPDVDETGAESETTGENQETKADDSPFAFEIDDSVIYDAEGVTVTMDELHLENDALRMTFTMDNHNPDNKKASFVGAMNINGFEYPLYTCDIQSVSADESDTQTLSIPVDSILEFQEMIDAESMSVEYLAIHYSIQIGSDSEWIAGDKIFENPTFEDDFTKIYGDKITEFNYDIYYSHDGEWISVPVLLQVYEKHTEKNNTLITLRRIGYLDLSEGETVGFDSSYIDVSLNDVSISNIQVCLFEQGSLVPEMYARHTSDAVYCIVYDTPENIRKALEIANDVPLEANLYIRDMIDYYGTGISVPISLE
ncbi:MAG: hypothetical protein K2M91_02215 [Lachnospiraceae bacterium]|nr:hypothetical protein [Lachnospiraceae bacterium]